MLASVTGLDLGGPLVGCLVVADLTGLVESGERSRLATEYATIGVTLQSPQGRFILVNPAVCQMLGRDAQTLNDMTWQDVTHPDDVSVGEGLIDDLAAGRVPSFRVRKRYLRPDGSVIRGDMSMSCVRNDDGSPQNYIAQIVDVSEQVQAEQSLAESQEHYRLLAENASDLVFMAGPDRRVSWIAPGVTAVLGWSPQDLVGTNMARPAETGTSRRNGSGPGTVLLWLRR